MSTRVLHPSGRGRPRQYTDEEARSRRNARHAQRVTKDRESPKDCAVPTCTKSAYPRRPYCNPHDHRATHYGSPLAGPLHPRDFKRSVRRVLAAFVKIEQAHPGLLALATKEIEALVIHPGISPLPLRKHQSDADYLLAVALHELQNPHIDHQTSARKKTPLTGREALVAAMAGWCCASVPGSVSQVNPRDTARSKTQRRYIPPRYETPDAIACLVAHSVLRQRKRPDGCKIPALAVAKLGHSLVATFGKLVMLVRRQVERSLVSSNKARATKARKAILTPPPVPRTKQPLTFHLQGAETIEPR